MVKGKNFIAKTSVWSLLDAEWVLMELVVSCNNNGVLSNKKFQSLKIQFWVFFNMFALPIKAVFENYIMRLIMDASWFACYTLVLGVYSSNGNFILIN